MPRNRALAVPQLEAAAALGHAGATNHLGWAHATGQGVAARDIERARALFKAAADAGDARARCNLGVLTWASQPAQRGAALRLLQVRREA